MTRYVHLNPVKIKRFKHLPLDERRKLLRSYPWSSYRSYAGLNKKKDKRVDHGPLNELVSEGRSRREVAYRRYVEAGLANDDDELKEALKRSRKAIGMGPFCRWVDLQYQRLADKQGQPLDVAMRRMELPASPDEVLNAVGDEFGVERADLMKRRSTSDARLVAMKLLKEEAGLTQREVAVRLGLRDGSTISRKLSEVSERLGKQRALHRRYVRLRNRIGHKH